MQDLSASLAGGSQFTDLGTIELEPMNVATTDVESCSSGQDCRLHCFCIKESVGPDSNTYPKKSKKEMQMTCVSYIIDLHFKCT